MLLGHRRGRFANAWHLVDLNRRTDFVVIAWPIDLPTQFVVIDFDFPVGVFAAFSPRD